MSEQQPLIPSRYDLEGGENVGKIKVYREKVANVLEHKYLHTTVLLLVSSIFQCHISTVQ
jgi:hypothetical protein